MIQRRWIFSLIQKYGTGEVESGNIKHTFRQIEYAYVVLRTVLDNLNKYEILSNSFVIIRSVQKYLNNDRRHVNNYKIDPIKSRAAKGKNIKKEK